MSGLGIPEHLYAWRTELRRNCALYRVRELRKREPRECANLCALRKAAGTTDRSSPTTKCPAGAANGMPELSQDVSGRRQVLRFLRPAARAGGRRNRSPAAAAGSGAPARRCAGARQRSIRRLRPRASLSSLLSRLYRHGNRPSLSLRPLRLFRLARLWRVPSRRRSTLRPHDRPRRFQRPPQQIWIPRCLLPCTKEPCCSTDSAPRASRRISARRRPTALGASSPNRGGSIHRARQLRNQFP